MSIIIDSLHNNLEIFMNWRLQGISIAIFSLQIPKNVACYEGLEVSPIISHLGNEFQTPFNTFQSPVSSPKGPRPRVGDWHPNASRPKKPERQRPNTGDQVDYYPSVVPFKNLLSHQARPLFKCPCAGATLTPSRKY